MKRAYFVTGTDTGIGKTFVSCALLAKFAHQGLRAVGMKPVAAGCRSVADKLVSDDVEQLLAAGNVAATPEEVNPYAFEPPIAPHLAARQVGVKIELDRIAQHLTALQEKADVVIVEGIGGFCVPLNDSQSTADMAITLGLPVILVVGMRLGCLNHALLTYQAIQHTGLPFAGWVANCISPDMQELQKNIAALESLLPTPCIATLPLHDPAQAEWNYLPHTIGLKLPA